MHNWDKLFRWAILRRTRWFLWSARETQDLVSLCPIRGWYRVKPRGKSENICCTQDTICTDRMSACYSKQNHKICQRQVAGISSSRTIYRYRDQSSQDQTRACTFPLAAKPYAKKDCLIDAKATTANMGREQAGFGRNADSHGKRARRNGPPRSKGLDRTIAHSAQFENRRRGRLSRGLCEPT